ncbi:MAG TPA: DUF308 domain-containing protein [Pyrinomonadaceae bacterium]|nr:DUF308 domain-containing protein [Pyrinomonadaceae bacterium]
MTAGICTIIAGAKLQSTYKRDWLVIASGILRVILVFSFGLLALMLIVAGAIEIAAAIRLRKQVNGTAFLALAGIVSMVFLPLLFVVPRGISPFELFGGLLIIFGASSVAFGLTLRTSARSAP